jgi:acetylornithine deacetylase/succinyl-diaminopimelate desuccinylase-like protein
MNWEAVQAEAHHLFHAPNERVAVEGFHWGLRVFHDVVWELCCGERD